MHSPLSVSHGPIRRLLLCSAVWLAAVGPALGQALVFSNFSTTTGLTLTSSSTKTTTADGSVLRLVSTASNDTGAAFSNAQFNVTNGFSTSFDFRLSNRTGSSDGTAVGADGFVFVIQNVGVSALGASGEGMGFLNIGTASFGVEFDTFQNANRGDPSSNHLGIDTGGSVNSLVTANVTPDFDSDGTGTKWTGWIDYNAANSSLEVRVSNTGSRPATANLTYSISPATLQSTLGSTSAFIGFTAATGGATENQDIVAWTFTNQYVPGGVTAGLAIPEPGTYALLALGLGLVWMRRRATTRGR